MIVQPDDTSLLGQIATLIAAGGLAGATLTDCFSCGGDIIVTSPDRFSAECRARHRPSCDGPCGSNLVGFPDD